MLSKFNGVLLAVNDADVATKTFNDLFGTEVVNEVSSPTMNARVVALGCGEDLIGLAQPAGPGPIAEHIDAWGEGIVGVSFASNDVDAVRQHVETRGVKTIEDVPGVFLVDPAATHGLLTFVVPHVDREKVGIVDFLYEVTHLVHDWKAVSEFWTDIFGLDGMKFSPIESKQYGYTGMLTLFDPPDKLDRIEVVHPHDSTKAMGKFFVKRGEGPYMFFCECADLDGLRDRLDAIGARYAPKERSEQPNSIFLHPSSTRGVLIGVSPKNLAWVWSGRPELAKAAN